MVGSTDLSMALFLSTTIFTVLVAATKRGALGKRHAQEGSFLLTSGQMSTAARIIAEKKHTQSPGKATGGGGDNERVGRDLISQREKQMGPNVSVFYKEDGGLVVTSGKGSYMRDVDGNLHLDCCNNVAAVGHAHPAVVAAGCAELSQIQTNGRFLHPTRQRFLKKFLATFPSELNVVYLVNSGSEANDLALRIARMYSTRLGKAAKPNDVIVLDSAYHGHTQSLVEISPYKWYQAIDGVDYQPASTHVSPLPDTFRGKYRASKGLSLEQCGAKYAEEVKRLVSATGGVGTFIAESIVGCGGQVVMPPGFLPAAYKAVREAGGVCIADEVQTGFARAGSHFWTFEKYGVVPDIVTCGKPMGNGYPVAAVICRREVAEAFASTGIEYFNTYGGNSVACAISEAVLDTIVKEDLQGNALRVGEYIQKKFQPLLEKYDWIGDVRGFGLFQGVEFVRSRASPDLQPYPELTKFVVDYLRYEGVIISRDGPNANVIKIKPPLVFSDVDADKLIATIDAALDVARSSGAF